MLGGGYAVLADDLKEKKSRRLARKSREEGTERQQEESIRINLCPLIEGIYKLTSGHLAVTPSPGLVPNPGKKREKRYMQR